MTPAARVQAAIELLDRWLASDAGMDRLLAQWGRANRYAGSGDRRAVADHVYDALRRMRSAAWVAGADAPDGRALMRGSLLLDGAGAAALFTGAAHAPAPLREDENTPPRPLGVAGRPIRLDLPEWLAPEFADLPDLALEPLRRRATLFLRVNTLKTTRDEARAVLAEDAIESDLGPLVQDCLAVPKNAHRVRGARAYREGLVEIQDAASQAVAAYAAARPGEAVLDFCAGAGGKTLALASAMAGQGRLCAHDTAPGRLAQLPPRAARAGAGVTLLDAGGLSGYAEGFDLVFADALCSGSGAWARNPDAKWRLTRPRLDELLAEQDQILDEAAKFVRPGGRLVYATCSLLEAENGDRVAAFILRNPDFRSDAAPLRLTPADGADGFFAAMLVRAAGRRFC